MSDNVKKTGASDGKATEDLTTESAYYKQGYTPPNNADAVPDLSKYTDPRTFKVKPTNAAADINSELAAWNDRIRLSLGIGLPGQRLTNSLMGFNHRMANNPLPTHREYGGITLVTRPDFNLTAANISNSRLLSDMASQPKSSLDYSILAALDPDFELGFSDPSRRSDGRVKSRFGVPFLPEIPFDNLQAFIPLLSTQLQAFSGPPDNSVDNWLSNEGLMREQWGLVDSTDEINYAYSGSGTYNNPIGDPVMRLATVWLHWMGGLKTNRFKKKMRNSIQRRVDYQSRTYHIRYDALGNILRFVCVPVMWPTNNNAGSMANIDNSKSLMDGLESVTINWQCIGARYNDPAYMDVFNDTVAMTNPDMLADPNYEDFVPIGAGSLRQLQPMELPFFNYYGYPHIDSWRRKITWWVYQADYEYVMKKAGVIK